jgi:Transposase and inactivated derivatives, IS30 family
MKKWKHINFEQRKFITSSISHNYKLKEIGELLSLDPTSISKEVKRNRILIDPSSPLKKDCPKLNRWPFVCSNCKLRYKPCPFIKYKYVSKTAHNLALYKLINSRRGLDIDNKEFKILDSLIKAGVDDGKSIYQIKIENNDVINKSTTTLYRYINCGYLTTKRIDLPYAVKYKRRKHKKKYEYSNNKIDRSNHTYLDYLSHIHKNKGVSVWQLDFLGSIKTDSKSILTFILPEIQFTIIEIIKNPDSKKVVDFFDYLEEKIGTENFKDLIPVILTDRDPCFNDIEGICFSKITGEERCKLFYCDPYVSNQKPHVENQNKQLRLFFPKKKSIDKYNKEDIKLINQTILNKPLRSLDSNTPKEAFIAVLGEDLYYKLFK